MDELESHPQELELELEQDSVLELDSQDGIEGIEGMGSEQELELELELQDDSW